MGRHRKKKAVGKVQVVAASAGARVADIVFNVRRDFREMMVSGGLAVMASLLEEDLVGLCGPRYGHSNDAALGERWGSQRGFVVMGGQKMAVDRPRARRDGKEVSLPTYDLLRDEDPLDARSLEQMVVGVSTRKYGRSIDAPAPGVDRYAVSKSAVSRRFVAKTQAQLEVALGQPLGDRQWAALLIDGIAFADHVVVIALGIDASGEKHLLGMREGSTENATLCREMLSEMVCNRSGPAKVQ